MDSSDNYFGWELGDTEGYLRTLNSDAPNTPPGYWLPVDPNATTSAVSPTQAVGSDSQTDISVDIMSAAATRDSQPADSPWVSFHKIVRRDINDL